MTKTVRKLRPADFWRVEEHESWFSDMSEQGLHIYNIGTNFAKFKKGERKQMEYRLKLAKDKYISNEKIKVYEDNGWDYIASDRYFHIFAAPSERKVKEVEFDPVEYMAVLNAIHRKVLLNLLVTVIGAGFMIYVLFLLLENTPVLNLIGGGLEVAAIPIIMNIFYIHSALKDWIGIIRVRKKFKEGELLDHHKPWEIPFLFNKIFLLFQIIITLLIIVVGILQIVKMEYLTLPEEDSSLPIVRLASIEKNPHLVREDWENYVSVNWSAFAPVYYEVVENGVEKKGEWADPNNAYSSQIYSDIYQLRFQFLVAPLVDDLVKNINHETGNTQKFTEKAHEKFDQLLIREEDDLKKFIFVKDNAVMCISYNGQVNAEVVIEHAAEKISLLTNK